MTVLNELKPVKKLRVMDLLDKAGIDVSHWGKDFKGVHPATNPKYCYNWSFEQSGEVVAVCLWHAELDQKNGTIIFKRNGQQPGRIGAGQAIWKRRDEDFGAALELAYRQQIPLRVILLDGIRYDLERGQTKASQVKARLLDPVEWAVTAYNYSSGDCILVRGEKPALPAVEGPDAELAWFEGESRRQFIYHRRREGAARREKIRDALTKNGGLLICEVPGCGFEFAKTYGELGQGYAHVHHLRPLKEAPKQGRKTTLADLAVVCPNCHAMIHLGGKCRALSDLIAGI